MVYFGNTTKSSLTYFYSFSKILTYKVDSIVEHTGFLNLTMKNLCKPQKVSLKGAMLKYQNFIFERILNT